MSLGSKPLPAVASRRRFVALAGASLGWVSLGGGHFAAAQVPASAPASTATGPWRLAAQTPADVRLDALRYAVLAPNPHNRQPWRIQLVGEQEVVLRCDLERRLPATDPFDRQITVGFGCFVELAVIAAAQRGFEVEVTPFPEGQPQPRLDGTPIARLRFVRNPAVRPDALFAHMLDRRSTKVPYDLARAVTAETMAPVLAAVNSAQVAWTNDAQRLATARQLIVSALEAEALNPPTHMESVNLMRIGRAEIDANPDGISLGGPVIEDLAAKGVISRTNIANPVHPAFKQGLSQNQAMYGSIPALIWLRSEGNSRVEQFNAGRSYVRLNLAATGAGLAMHPMSQCLQEYQEVAPQFDQMHALLGVRAPGRVQMLARIGWGPQVGPKPRWALERKLV